MCAFKDLSLHVPIGFWLLILDSDSFQGNKSLIFRFKGCVFGIFVFNVKTDAFDGYQGPQSISMIIKCDVYLLKKCLNTSLHSNVTLRHCCSFRCPLASDTQMIYNSSRRALWKDDAVLGIMPLNQHNYHIYCKPLSIVVSFCSCKHSREWDSQQ